MQRAPQGRRRQEQHTAGRAVALGDEVEAMVHAVNQINVGMPRRAEDNAGAVDEAGEAVRRPIAAAKVRFHLDDAPHRDRSVQTMNDDFPQQIAGDRNRVPRVK